MTMRSSFGDARLDTGAATVDAGTIPSWREIHTRPASGARKECAGKLAGTLHAYTDNTGAALQNPPTAPDVDVATWIRDGLDQIPFPGKGETVARWRALAATGAYDLSAAKLYESHTDALAILAELAPNRVAPSGMGAVWAAENGIDRLHFDGHRLSGRKPWCSGAHATQWALVTAWPEHESDHAPGRRLLVLVDMRLNGISHDTSAWSAVGMTHTRTAVLSFDHVEAVPIGDPDSYISRPGFWHGGIGIAAVWYGAACAIGARVAAASPGDVHKSMHLGAIDGYLTASRALLVEAATAIDAAPLASSYLWALRTRTVIDDAARRVIDHAGRALGAAPFCQEPAFARRMADLPVFLRQSHAEKDLIALGTRLTEADSHGISPWQL
ncbi:hypothetical protein JOE11_000168 [Robbsia andropogonis]|uniref:acyl-CoA dehydrogenase n=1 Tax=Robbsia andropogonis TaxID=28092 RepID=UPI003D1CFABA